MKGSAAHANVSFFQGSNVASGVDSGRSASWCPIRRPCRLATQKVIAWFPSRV